MDVPTISQMREVRLGKVKWPVSLTPLKSILVGFPGGVGGGGIRLPRQGTWVRSLVLEDLTCLE